MQYKPEILPLLTQRENRIPEATIEYVNRTIHFQIEKVYEDLVNYTVMYNVIPTRKATRPFQIGGKVKPTVVMTK